MYIYIYILFFLRSWKKKQSYFKEGASPRYTRSLAAAFFHSGKGILCWMLTCVQGSSQVEMSSKRCDSSVQSQNSDCGHPSQSWPIHRRVAVCFSQTEIVRNVLNPIILVVNQLTYGHTCIPHHSIPLPIIPYHTIPYRSLPDHTTKLHYIWWHYMYIIYIYM